MPTDSERLDFIHKELAVVQPQGLSGSGGFSITLRSGRLVQGADLRTAIDNAMKPDPLDNMKPRAPF